MKTLSVKPQKVQVTTNITKLAQDTMLDHGYCGVRGMGEFISDLVMDFHAKRTRQLTQAEIAAELRRLADLLEEVGCPMGAVAPIASKTMRGEITGDIVEPVILPVAPIASAPMPPHNVIDHPSGLMGTTVLSEQPGPE